MKIRNKKTGALVSVPEHLQADVKKIIAMGGDPMTILQSENIPLAKNGIHIKKKNVGKFNATKKRTGKTTEELTHSKNPLTRKRAVFAQNATKWKKAQDGTFIDEPALVGGEDLDISQTFDLLGVQNPFRNTDNLSQTNPNNFDYNAWLNSGVQLPNKPPQTISVNPYINRMSQGIQAIAKGNEQDNDALMAAGVVKTAFGAGAGLTNLASNIKQNYFTNKQENSRTFSQLDGALFNPYITQNRSKGTNNNPTMFESGGMTIKKLGGKGMPNVEVENDEHIKLTNGFSDHIYGKTHAEGGINLNLPEGSMVFSEKLKDPMTNKSYSKLAKKFETKKDFDHLEAKTSDKINKQTAELNIQLKNNALDELFMQQEQNKLTGVHGLKAQKNAMKDYKMKYGGMKKMDGTSGSNMTPFESTTESRKKPSWWSDRAKLEEMMSNFEKTSGHSFPYYTPDYDVNKMAADYQKAVISKYPQIVTNLFKNKALPFTNKAVELYKKQNKTKTTPNETELIKFYNKNPQLITEQFGDDLWGMRGFEMQDLPFSSPEEYNAWKQDKDWIGVGNNYFYDVSGENETPIVYKPKLNYPLGEKTVKPSTPYGGLDLQDTGATTTPISKRDMPTFIAPIGRTYGRLPIQKLQLTPEEFVPELINPQAQINEITRGTYKGSSTVDRSNKAQDFTNQYANIQEILGSTANQNALIKNQARQYNLQNRQNINRLNTNYAQSFLDNIAQREAAIQSQKLLDQDAYTKALADLQHQENTLAYLGDIYNPAFANARLNTSPTKKKYGGKIKIKKKTKK